MVRRPTARHPWAMVGVSPDHTSVPRWPAVPAGVNPAGTSYLVLSSGPAGAAVADGWLAEIRAGAKSAWTCQVEGTGTADDFETAAGPDWVAALVEALDRARVGVRIMVAGPELVVLDAARAARGAGALDAELTLHATHTGLKRIRCVHCHTDTRATVEVAETVRCAGCERDLVVYHHLSRRLGAYFGYFGDAERAP
jgi:hypothetical protein